MGRMGACTSRYLSNGGNTAIVSINHAALGCTHHPGRCCRPARAAHASRRRHSCQTHTRSQAQTTDKPRIRKAEGEATHNTFLRGGRATAPTKPNVGHETESTAASSRHVTPPPNPGQAQPTGGLWCGSDPVPHFTVLHPLFVDRAFRGRG